MTKTLGADYLLERVRNIMETHGNLSRQLGSVESALKDKKAVEEKLAYAVAYLERQEKELRILKKIVAEYIRDAVILGCTEEDIIKYWPGYTGHDVAEWITLND